MVLPGFHDRVGGTLSTFVFMYGMWQFAGLCTVLVSCGVALGMYLPAPLSIGAWVTAAVLLVFAFMGCYVAIRMASAESNSR